MTITVASGKGGTGKTTIAVNLARVLQNVTLVDCDVEEPNAHIFLRPEIRWHENIHVGVPKVDGQKCDRCGRCAEFCRFNAIAVLGGKTIVFPEICHHCGGCMLVCPQGAIIEQEVILGKVEGGTSGSIDFVHGVSQVGFAEATPIIARLKGIANQGSAGENGKTVIIDAPPGTSCLMVEAVRGSDFCILVTEPTPFGLNDLILAVEVLRDFRIPFGVVINQADIGDRQVLEYCGREQIPVLLEIPFSRRIAESYSRGELIVEALPRYGDEFRALYRTIRELL